MGKLTRILVPVDASRGARRAVALAAELAAATGAELDVLHVSYFDPETDAIEATWLDASVVEPVADEERAALEQARELIPETVQAAYHHRTGTPADAILEFARESGTGLIVVGARGLGVVEGFLLGSISQEIVERATVAVVVAK